MKKKKKKDKHKSVPWKVLANKMDMLVIFYFIIIIFNELDMVITNHFLNTESQKFKGQCIELFLRQELPLI